ncbi:uncharacterized protein LOC116264646 [Nymphaea colorata]|nr:uncharacterized protein LOC116264646 [Nymphaea colorata]
MMNRMLRREKGKATMARKGVQYAVLDAFTNSPFCGNPAAVCLLGGEGAEKDERWMKSVAKEFNLSQTAFLIPESDVSGGRRFHLRWFTPMAEVDLCGHATLASAHFLFSSGLVGGNKVEFLTRSGVLTADKVEGFKSIDGQAEGSFAVELDFPVIPVVECSAFDIPSIPTTLNGATISSIKKASTDDLIIEVMSGNVVKDIQPQFDELEKCPGRGIIITGAAPQGSGFDFFSRFFCPKLGITEDPVCGSAHCALAPYWSKKLGKHDLVAHMASPRGGKLVLQFKDDRGRVLIRGEAVTVMEGSILV